MLIVSAKNVFDETLKKKKNETGNCGDYDAEICFVYLTYDLYAKQPFQMVYPQDCTQDVRDCFLARNGACLRSSPPTSSKVWQDYQISGQRGRPQ